MLLMFERSVVGAGVGTWLGDVAGVLDLFLR